MPQPKITEEGWKELRICAESGMGDDELSETYNVSKESIRQRRKREKWLTPKALKEMAMIQEAKEKAKRMNNESVTSVTESPSAVSTMASKLAKLKEETPFAIAEKTAALILEGLKTLQAPRGWKETAIAAKIFSDSVGLNKGGGMVIQVGGAAWGQGSQGPEKPRIVTIQAEEA